MVGYIYLTTNLINNKRYVGRKTSPTFVEDYHGSGVHIKNAVKKYGEDSLKLLLLSVVMIKVNWFLKKCFG